MKHLLVLNNGSSSLKFAVFETAYKKLGREILSGSISLLGDKSILVYRYKRKKFKINYHSGLNIKLWWQYLHDILADIDINYVGFRMVHGGEEFTDTVRVNNSFLNKVKKYNSLAPLHNPITLELIKLVRSFWPRVKMAVSFDTSWYKDMEPEAYLYSIPLKYYSENKIRKYGFHGLSHEAATNYASIMLHKKLDKLKVITCHLGSGSSITWYINGKVKDTTMGFSPNEGLTMATRSGDIPANIVFYLAKSAKMTLKEISTLLNKKSGLLGLSGTADLREVLLASGYKVEGYKSKKKFSPTQKKSAKLALHIYIYDIKRYLASYLGMSKNLDAIVFTGAVGANGQVRKMVLKGLDIDKKTKIIFAPQGEIENIAKKTILCLIK